MAITRSLLILLAVQILSAEGAAFVFASRIGGISSESTGIVRASVAALETDRRHRPVTRLASGNFDEPFEYFDDDDEYDDHDEDEFDIGKLRMKAELSEQLGLLKKTEDVFIIFICPDTDEEGVHAIEYPKDSGNNFILAFQCEDECEEFALDLRDQDFFDATPDKMNLKELVSFSKHLGLEVQIVPEGSCIVPPKAVKETLSHNPYLKKTRNKLDKLFRSAAYEETLLSAPSIDEGVIMGDEAADSWE